MNSISRDFSDRTHAGQCLAERLRGMRLPSPVVVAVPRGGMEVGAAVASALGAELDFCVVARVCNRQRPHLTLAAISEDERVHTLPAPWRCAEAPRRWMDHALDRALLRVRYWRAIYRAVRPAAPLPGRTVILVDEGATTGLTMLAAAANLLARGAPRMVLALPCAQRSALALLQQSGHHVICLRDFSRAGRIGRCYGQLPVVPESRVIALLSDVAQPPEL